MPRPVPLTGCRKFAPLAPRQPVFAIAQKSEMTILHPLEQGAGLAQLGGIDPRAQAAQLHGGAARGSLHARPIRTGHAHVRMLRSICAASDLSTSGSTIRSTSTC